MKTAILAALLGSTQAVKVNLKAAVEAEAGDIGQTCTANYERAMQQANWTLADATNGNVHSGMYEDPSFPADMSSMYWNRQEPYNNN